MHQCKTFGVHALCPHLFVKEAWEKKTEKLKSESRTTKTNWLSLQDAITRVQSLEKMGQLSGVMDDRGKVCGLFASMLAPMGVALWWA